MGEDFVEIDVSVDPRIVVAGFGFFSVADSTSTRGRAVFVDVAYFGLFGLFTADIECLPPP